MTDPIEREAHTAARASALAGTPDVAMLAELLRPAVVAAATACLPLVGHGDGDALDGAAVAAMRTALARLPVDGRVVVGEGEKDDAPMLHLGERFGRARDGDPAIDLAVAAAHEWEARRRRGDHGGAQQLGERGGSGGGGAVVVACDAFDRVGHGSILPRRGARPTCGVATWHPTPEPCSTSR